MTGGVQGDATPVRRTDRAAGGRRRRAPRTGGRLSWGRVPGRDRVHPARSGFPDRNAYRVPPHRRDLRPLGGTRAGPRRRRSGRVGEGVHTARRDAAADRPDSRRPALPLRKTQTSRDERAGRRRSLRSAAVGPTGAIRRAPRRSRDPRARRRRHPRPSRPAPHHAGPGAGREGLPACSGKRRSLPITSAPFGVHTVLIRSAWRKPNGGINVTIKNGLLSSVGC